ncbi:MAG: hypothetical protein Tsb0021_05470 [Chlamydiales bacterium]
MYVLCVKRNQGFWEFPKGHKENEETDYEAAFRELKEETSLQVKALMTKQSFTNNYEFFRNGTKILKTVHYFIALTEGDVKLQPEEISDSAWCDIDEAIALLTFENSKQLCHRIKKWILNSDNPYLFIERKDHA